MQAAHIFLFGYQDLFFYEGFNARFACAAFFNQLEVPISW